MIKKYIITNLENNSYYNGSNYFEEQITEDNFNNYAPNAMQFDSIEEAEKYMKYIIDCDIYGIFTIIEIYEKE